MERALEHLKVLDLSMNLPGPYMTWLLATLGAEVVKVENPAGGDYARMLAGSGGGATSPFFESVNRNKKSVALNLKHSKGRELFLRLLDTYDVLVEGFRPGTMERLDLGFATLIERQPRLIQVAISGYGQDGPYRYRAGHDINYLSLAGIIGMTGTNDGEPALIGVQVADLAGGSLFALSTLLAAVIQRERTGRGQFVDVSMFHGSLSLATLVFAGVAAGMEQPRPGKMVLNGRLPCYGLYRTKDDLYMSLGALEPKFWVNFCNAVNRPDMLGDQFGGPEIVAQVQEVFGSRRQNEWVELMTDHDCCCEPVIPLSDAVDSELVLTKGMVTQGALGQRCLGSPIRLSESPPAKDAPAPQLGGHTREVLGPLGLSSAELDSLRKEGVI